MKIDPHRKKKNTGLLPQFENPLGTSAFHGGKLMDCKKYQTDFLGVHKALRRLMDQAKAIPKDQLVQEMADLLQARLGIDYMWIAEIDEDNLRLNILGGRSKSGLTFKGPYFFLENSPFEQTLIGKCLVLPRSALVSFPHNPYMLKFNINGIVAYPVCLKGTVVGILAAMDTTAIRHPDEICKLFCEVAPEAADLMFT